MTHWETFLIFLVRLRLPLIQKFALRRMRKIYRLSTDAGYALVDAAVKKQSKDVLNEINRTLKMWFGQDGGRYTYEFCRKMDTLINETNIPTATRIRAIAVGGHLNRHLFIKSRLYVDSDPAVRMAAAIADGATTIQEALCRIRKYQQFFAEQERRREAERIAEEKKKPVCPTCGVRAEKHTTDGYFYVDYAAPGPLMQEEWSEGETYWKCPCCGKRVSKTD